MIFRSILVLVSSGVLASGCGIDGWLWSGGSKAPAPSQPVISDCNLLPQVQFSKTANLAGWAETIWYDKKDSGGLTSLRDDGVYFDASTGNSRSGFRYDFLDNNLSDCQNLLLKLTVNVKSQTLAGTGYDAREAPAAVAISYIDVNGLTHSSLNAINSGDPDDRASSRLFWQGFYTVASSGREAGGVKVEAGKNFDYSVDLMAIEPKPAKILWLTLEGSGWAPRSGSFQSASLIGETKEAASRPKSDDSINKIPSPTPTEKPVTDNTIKNPITQPCHLISSIDFNSGAMPNGWQEVIWYKPQSSAGQVSFQADGVHFKSLEQNSRAGIRYSFADHDLSDCHNLILTYNGKILAQSLGGTGFDAREAPFAVVISYVDEAGTDHTTLNAINSGEPDDRNSTRMFWRGVYSIPSYGREDAGFFYEMGRDFSFSVDLMYDLPIKPKKINYIAFEGAGWKDRESVLTGMSFFGYDSETFHRIMQQ
jgi:hypothetical protein